MEQTSRSRLHQALHLPAPQPLDRDIVALAVTDGGTPAVQQRATEAARLLIGIPHQPVRSALNVPMSDNQLVSVSN